MAYRSVGICAVLEENGTRGENVELISPAKTAK
jgi:hypothetical protein